ncbi:MAG: serine hydrolase domain-containing protein [Bacteroidales bacterium]|nr:serine hydrolase domain-containing protein [Bacteroidales bacterium]
MKKTASVQKKIEKIFRQQVHRDKKLKNAYLLVHSEKLGIDLNLAAGETDGIQANPKQANHMASVGKLFTATIIGMLNDRGQLNFDDPLVNYLDNDITQNLHIYKGKDYTREITVKHLLTQTSGLNDVFFPLLKKMIQDPTLKMNVREALEWGKANLRPVGKPGQRHFYTDTNYYLLGLIIENITKEPFYKVLDQMIFQPLGMENAYLHGFSAPKQKAQYPPAHIYLYNINFINNERIAQIDYAGGGIVAPLDEYLSFMKALVNHQLVKDTTLQRMIYDDIKMGFPALGFDYGYSIWKPKAIPLLMPKEYFCWGCVGITGAFMFFHPSTQTYVIGTFNDQSYTSKALRFMLMKVIKPLIKINPSKSNE